LAVYTSYQMVPDCRANKSEGWTFLVTQYVPVMRTLLARYFPERAADAALINRILAPICRPDSDLFQDRGMSPEREFVADLRQHLLAAVEADRAGVVALAPVDLEILTNALAEFTALERQAVWMRTMRYDAASAGPILRMEVSTAESAAERAAEALRGHLDQWSRDVLETNGAALGREAALARTENCLPSRSFLDMIDGKMTWKRRGDIEFHLTQCWHCVDYFCRLREVDEIMRTNKPLTVAEAAPFLALLGIKPAEEKKSFWKRIGK